MRLMTAYICLNIMQDFFNATYEKYLSNYLHPLTSKTLCGGRLQKQKIVSTRGHFLMRITFHYFS